MSNEEQHTRTPLSDTALQGASSRKGTLRDLFDDLSIAQVVAGALAAATVFFLSSTIGWAGSLIGVVVGSVVSAISSQVYKKMLSASADKIRDKAPTTRFGTVGETGGAEAQAGEPETGKAGLPHAAELGDKAGAGDGEPGSQRRSSCEDEAEAAMPETGKAEGEAGQSEPGMEGTEPEEQGRPADKDEERCGRRDAVLASPMPDAAKTVPADIRKASPMTWVVDANDIRYRAQQPTDDDPALRRAHARRNRKAHYRRRVLIVSIVSALIAIAISSLVIVLATSGEGIGSKPQPIMPSQAVQEEPSSEADGSSADTGDGHGGSSSGQDDAAHGPDSPSVNPPSGGADDSDGAQGEDDGSSDTPSGGSDDQSGSGSGDQSGSGSGSDEGGGADGSGGSQDGDAEAGSGGSASGH